MIIDELFEAPQLCPECGGISFSDLILAEKKDACYYKVKASAKVWPSAYASGRLVQCRKKGAANYGKSKTEGVAEGLDDIEDTRQFRNAIALAKSQKAIRQAKDGKDAKYYADGTKVTPAEVARRAAERKAKKQGVAEQQELDEKWSQKYKKSINCANPKGFSQRAHCAGRKKNEDVAEAGPIRRDPLDLPPLEGPGSGGGGGGGPSRSGPSPFTPVKIPGTNINIPGVTQSTSPPPVVTKTPNINKQLDPALDVPAYVRQGKPDPVTLPVGKPKITVRPGETVPQAMQRTKAEQEFGQFLKGQSGQTFGAGAGRGSQGGPTASQATSGANQVPTIKLPGGQTIPDPARLSPSGQYNTQSKSNTEMDKIIQKWDKEQRSAPPSLPSQSKSKTSPSKFLQLFGPDKMDEASRKKREQPEVDYDDEYDAMVARVKKLAGLGPMKTVYDPTKRVYRNMPTAVQPKK